jgi:hypothetical protein
MTFWTGFATGLAKSVDQGLKKAMDKRDDELSRAKTFWQTRQAQKLDQKEAYDARAEKAMRRMITEAGGDTTLALAAWNAAGGDADGNEKFLERLDKTRASKGKFALTDAIVMPADYVTGDNKYSSEDLIKSVRMNLPEFDKSRVSVSDFGEGTMFALRKGAGQQVADSLRDMTPEKVTAITDGPKASLDMSKMLEAEEYARGVARYDKEMKPTDKEMFMQLNDEISSLDRSNFGKGEEGELAFTQAKADATGKLESFLTRISAWNIAKEAGSGKTGLSDNLMKSLWTDSRSQGYLLDGIGIKDGQKYYTDENQNYVPELSDPEGYRRAVKASNARSADRFIRTQGSSGSFATSATNIIGADNDLTEAFSRYNKAKDGTVSTGTDDGSKPPVTTISFEDQKATVQANPMGALRSFMNKQGDKATPDAMLNLLRKYGYDDNEAVGLIQEAMKQNQPAPKKPSFADLTKKQTSVAKVNPRPIGSDQASQYAANDWDNQFAATHNPDGTPK